MIKKKLNKKKLTLRETEAFLENVSIDDNIKTEINRLRELHEDGLPIHGFITVIKNKGRPDEEIIQIDVENLLTTSGRDFFHNQLYTNVAPGTKGANAIALSAEATDPVVGDTTLDGEITTGGLTRVEASSIVHVVGTNLTTLEEVFTATIPFVDIHKSGLFNQNTIGGQMTQAREFDADVSLEIGDTVTVTWSITTG